MYVYLLPPSLPFFFSFILLHLKKIVFFLITFWGLCSVLLCCVQVLSGCSEWGYSFLWCIGFHCGAFSCCGTRALGVWASELQLSGSGVVASGPEGAWASVVTVCGLSS